MADSAENAEDLLTPLAFALSLSAPRAPPLGSAQRAFMLGENPTKQKLLKTFSCFKERQQKAEDKREQLEYEIVWKVLRRCYQHQRSNRFKKNHPHLSFKQDRDSTTRGLGTSFSIEFWNFVRDGGHFRFLVDGLVTLGIPSLALSAPQAALKFQELSSSSLQQLMYGTHKRHIIDVFTSHSRRARNKKDPRLLVFIHGGAWGSGRSWMYRLVCHQFRDWTIAVVGYRTYPDATVEGQVEDLNSAYEVLKDNFPNHMMCIMGHSSGAHIGLIHVVHQAKKRLESLKHREEGKSADIGDPQTSSDENNVNGFCQYAAYVGLSGPYNVSHHFDYEAARGVEELSPLKPVNGMTREALIQNSPVWQIQQLLLQYQVMANENNNECFLPQNMLLVHGIEDTTVPFTATAEAASKIRSSGLVKQVDEIYVAKTGHQDTVFQLMLGGAVLDKVSVWLENLKESSAGKNGIITKNRSDVVISSRL